MRGKKKIVRRKSGWRATNPDPAIIGPLLREMAVMPSEGDPVEVTAHYDRQDRPRRIHAIYADGWRSTVQLHLDGSFAVSHAIRMVSRKLDA